MGQDAVSLNNDFNFLKILNQPVQELQNCFTNSTKLRNNFFHDVQWKTCRLYYKYYLKLVDTSSLCRIDVGMQSLGSSAFYQNELISSSIAKAEFSWHIILKPLYKWQNSEKYQYCKNNKITKTAMTPFSKIMM